MLADEEIGGAIVQQVIEDRSAGLHIYKRGDNLSRDAFLAMRNHRSLINSGHLIPYARSPVEECSGGRAIVHIGGGRYDVYAKKLNSDPLTKEEAEALAKKKH